MVSGESPDPWLVAQKTGEVGAAEWAEPDPARTRIPVGIGALGADSQKRLQVLLDRARIATPRQAFQLDEVEMRPDKPRLPRHDLIEGFLRALGFHLHQKPRLEVAG